jgi:hypothetical protein
MGREKGPAKIVGAGRIRLDHFQQRGLSSSNVWRFCSAPFQADYITARGKRTQFFYLRYQY